MLAQGHNVSVSIWLPSVLLHAADNVYGRRKSAMCLVIRGNKNVKCSAKFRNKFRMKQPHLNNLRRWVERFKENGSVSTRKSSGRPVVTEARSFLFWWVHEENCVHRRNERSATYEGQNLRRYWNSHARDAFSCMGGDQIQTGHM